jgi:putative SOS response-associated peptidase YedK
MRWGVVPHWSKHDDSKLNTINAKGENLVEGSAGMWASLKGKKRCVVPVQGYYEWLKQGSGRFPHFTKHKDGRIMLLAGMWDSVTFEGSRFQSRSDQRDDVSSPTDAKEPLYTFTIVTTSANTQVSWLHDRMPVILSEQKEIETWLNSELGWTAEVAKCVRPYPGELETYVF